MASIKNLKKDISYLADDIITALCYKSSEQENVDMNKTSELIVKVAALKNEYIAKANQAPTNDKKAVKAYFKSFNNDFAEKLNALVKEVNEL